MTVNKENEEYFDGEATDDEVKSVTYTLVFVAVLTSTLMTAAILYYAS